MFCCSILKFSKLHVTRSKHPQFSEVFVSAALEKTIGLKNREAEERGTCYCCSGDVTHVFAYMLAYSIRRRPRLLTIQNKMCLDLLRYRHS